MSDQHVIALVAASDMGKAAGLEAGAKVLMELASHNRRVVGTGELKIASAALRPLTQSNIM